MTDLETVPVTRHFRYISTAVIHREVIRLGEMVLKKVPGSGEELAFLLGRMERLNLELDARGFKLLTPQTGGDDD